MKKIKNAGKLLKKARQRYEQVCDQLDTLNSEATDLESQILRLESVIKNKGRRN